MHIHPYKYYVRTRVYVLILPSPKATQYIAYISIYVYIIYRIGYMYI